MRTEIKPFDFRGNQVRIVMQDDEPWFVAADVCAVLGAERTDSSLRRLDEDEKGTHNMSTPGGGQTMSIVSEAGLYRLTLSARTDNAKPFQRWVTHEVLPTLRRTGEYVLPGAKAKRNGQIDAFMESSRLFRASLRIARGVGVDNRAAAERANDNTRKLTGVDVLETMELRELMPEAKPDRSRRVYSDATHVGEFYTALIGDELLDIPALSVARVNDVYAVYKAWCARSGNLATSMGRLINIFTCTHGARTRRKRYLSDDGREVMGPHSIMWLDIAGQPVHGQTEMRWLGERITQFRDAADDYCTADD